MGKRVQRSLLLVGVLFGCLAAVASGTANPGERAPQGYSRLLERQAVPASTQGSLVADCLMEETRLRLASGASGVIPDRAFEELRHFCREAAWIEGQAARVATDAPSSADHEAARQRIRERHRLAMQAYAADREAPSPEEASATDQTPEPAPGRRARLAGRGDQGVSASGWACPSAAARRRWPRFSSPGAGPVRARRSRRSTAGVGPPPAVPPRRAGATGRPGRQSCCEA